MNCPICNKKDIPTKSKTCPQCDSDLSIYQIINELELPKKPVNNIHAIYITIIIIISIVYFILSETNSRNKRLVNGNNKNISSEIISNTDKKGINENENNNLFKNQNVFRIKVRNGDNLWKLARMYYGNGLKYKEIMNQNKLENENIKQGQVLFMRVEN